MEKEFRQESYIFRLYKINQEILEKFLKQFEHVESSVHKFKNSKKYTIKIKLSKANLSRINTSLLLKFIKKERISKTSYGVWVSLLTSNDMDGLTVPVYVMDFYKIVGGAFDFSFISN